MTPYRSPLGEPTLHPMSVTAAEWETIMLARHAARFDADGVHHDSKVCPECGWEEPYRYRAKCKGCGADIASIQPRRVREWVESNQQRKTGP